MKIRIHEIELGSSNPTANKIFYESFLSINGTMSNEDLAIVNPNINGLDLNFSTHFPAQKTCISFITDDLDEVIKRLETGNINYAPATKSHLGMLSISFEDADGNLVKVNMPTDESPEWLKV